MKIICEGYEAAGKSTLSKHIAHVLHLKWRTAGPPPSSDLAAMADCYFQYMSRDVVWDRVTSITRQAYQLDINDMHRRRLEQHCEKLQAQGALFIWCVGNGDHVLKDYDTPDHVKHVTDNETVIRNNYQDIMSNLDNCFVFDFKKQSIQEVLEWITNQASQC